MICWSWRPLLVFQTFRFNECGMILAITFTFQNQTHISNCLGQLLIWYICKDRSPQPSRKAVWICPPPTLPRESIEFPECIRSIVCLSLVVCLSCFSDNFQTSIIWEETMKILNKWKVSYSYKSFLLDMIFTTDDVMIQNSQSVIPDQKSPCCFLLKAAVRCVRSMGYHQRV